MKRIGLFALITVLFPIPAKALNSNKDDTHLLKMGIFPGVHAMHSHDFDRNRPRLKVKRTVTANGAEMKIFKDSSDRWDNETKTVTGTSQIETQLSSEAAPDLKLLQMFDPEWNSGFEAPNTVIPDIIMDLYESVKNESYNNAGQEADLIRCLRLTDYVTVSFGVIIKFALNHTQIGERIVGGELYLHRSMQYPLMKSQANFTILRLYKIESRVQISHEISERNIDVHELLAVIYLAPYEEGWQILNIAKSLEGTGMEGDSLQFLVTTSDIRGYPKNTRWLELNILDKKNFPFLAIKAQQPFKNVTTSGRKSGIYTQKEESTQCVRLPLHLSFEVDALKKFIIYPKRVLLHECVGKCILQLRNNFSNHAKLLKVLSELIGRTKTACCVPEDYSPLTLMFWNKDGNIIIKRYYNMIVNSCICM